eukprot:scaffold21426_cov57-Attheya_sp.AAC.1
MRGTSSPSLVRRGPNRIAMWCATGISLILITSSRKFAFAQDTDEYTTGGGLLRATSVQTSSSRFLKSLRVSKLEAKVRLELSRTEQIVLTDAFARRVRRVREYNNDEFLKIQQDYLSAVPVAHDPSDRKYNALYDSLYEELTHKNEKAKKEIVSEQAALSEVLVQLEGDLLELANELDPEEEGMDLIKESVEATRNELNDEIESLTGSLKGPICCILDNVGNFIDDPMLNKKFSRTLEATFNEVMLRLDLDSIMVPDSTQVTHQDWLDEIRFGSEDPQIKFSPQTRGLKNKRRQKQRRRRHKGRKLAVRLETEYTCGSLCLQTCNEKKIAALGADGMGQYCVPHSVNVQQDIVDKLNFQTQSLFANEFSDLVEMFNDEVGDHEAVERRATISCAACGEWSVDQGYENYVNPDILREVHGYATAFNKLVNQEDVRMQEFDLVHEQAINLYREKKDNAAMLLSVCIGDVNEKYTRRRRKLGKSGKASKGASPTKRPTRRPTKRPTKRPTRRPSKRPTRRPTRRPTPRPTHIPTQRPTSELELINNDQAVHFTAWEFDLMVCSVAREAAINAINVEFLDTTEKAQFNLDAQLQELAKKHEIILNGMGDYVNTLSVLVEEPLVREMETKRELEISTRERILERRTNMAMEVSNSITCEIHGVKVQKDFTHIELEQFEDLFVEAMDAAFRNAEIDLIMEDFVIEEECVLKANKEVRCTRIDNEHQGKRNLVFKRVHNARFARRMKSVRGRSTARCYMCRPRRIRADTASQKRRKLQSDLAIALNELTDQMDITEWEKSDTMRNLIVQDVNAQLTTFLKHAWRSRVTSKKLFDVVCYIDED